LVILILSSFVHLHCSFASFESEGWMNCQEWRLRHRPFLWIFPVASSRIVANWKSPICQIHWRRPPLILYLWGRASDE
jgi:hypothetical protein